jgi:hypothetical protein
VRMNYPLDLLTLRYRRINDSGLRFTRRAAARRAAARVPAAS